MNKTSWIIGLAIIAAALPGAGLLAMGQTSTAPSTIAGPVTDTPTAIPVTATSTPQPATQPSASAARVRGPAMIVERLRSAVKKLDLTTDQKSMIDPILEQAASDAQALAEELKDEDLQDRLPKVMAFGKSVRDKIEAELTDDQKQALEKNMQASNAPARIGPGGIGAGAGRFQQALAQLDLTSDQQTEIKDILEQNRQKQAEIRQNATGLAMQTQLQQLRQDLRQRLGQVLQPQQVAKLQELMQQNRPNRAGPQNAAAAKPDEGTSKDSPDGTTLATETKPADLESSGPDVGAAPPPVKLIELNGRTFDPTAYKGRVVVLEFGSLSCPTFRDQAPSINRLKNAETGRAFFVLVYTREAFPEGKANVERNQTEGFNIPLATTLDERKAEAREAQERLNLTLPVAVDTMDDAVADAYGLLPNGAVIIGKDGLIAARQKWTNAESLRRAIDDANGNAVAGQ
jgi:Spy/CpxP family protein refolding chaperone